METSERQHKSREFGRRFVEGLKEGNMVSGRICDSADICNRSGGILSSCKGWTRGVLKGEVGGVFFGGCL